MNHDSTTPSAPIPPELEARIVAWVAGELSDTEVENLSLLVAANPDLAAFKRRIESVHQLVGEAERPESAPLRLSSARRAKLLQTLRGTAEVPLQERIAALPKMPSPWSWRAPRLYYTLAGVGAACIAVLFTYQYQATPRYKAEATIQVVKQADSILSTQAVVDASIRSDVDVNTYLKILETAASTEPVIVPVPKAKVAQTEVTEVTSELAPQAATIDRIAYNAPAAPSGSPTAAFKDSVNAEAKKTLAAPLAVAPMPLTSTLSADRAYGQAAASSNERARGVVVVEENRTNADLPPADKSLLASNTFGDGRTSFADSNLATKGTSTSSFFSFDEKKGAANETDDATFAKNGAVGGLDPSKNAYLASVGVNVTGGTVFGSAPGLAFRRADAPSTTFGLSPGGTEPAIPPTDLTTVLPPVAAPSASPLLAQTTQGYSTVPPTPSTAWGRDLSVSNEGGFYASTTPPSDPLRFSTGAAVAATESAKDVAAAASTPASPLALNQDLVPLQSFAVAAEREGKAQALAPAVVPLTPLPYEPAQEGLKLDAFAVASSDRARAKLPFSRPSSPLDSDPLTRSSTVIDGPVSATPSTTTGPVSINTVGVVASGGGLNVATNGGNVSARSDVSSPTVFTQGGTDSLRVTSTGGSFGAVIPPVPATATASFDKKRSDVTAGTSLVQSGSGGLAAGSGNTGAGGGGRPASLLGAISRPAPAVGAAPARPDPATTAITTPAAVPDRDEARRPVAPPAPVAAPVETRTAQDPVSTFSLHVSDVSFRLAQAALARGEAPDPARIRPEEFYNAFDYGDPSTTAAEKIGARFEQAAHPFLQQRNLVRLALRAPATGRGAGTPLRLTVLLDTSGSMEREDRAASVRRALGVLVSLLGPDDRLTLIGFARTPRLLAEALPGPQARGILDLLARTPSEGGTNLEAALKLGADLARRHHAPGAQNRLVLLTDGAANLGDAEPAHLATLVTALRQSGIAFDACGVGLNGLDDEILEALTRQGDGRYYVLDSPEAADAGFARQLAGAFRPAAQNVKVQVRFNPARVGRYRLIGFEQHRLREQDFRNDKVDAAELAAEEAAVALYQVEVLPQGEGELGEVFVRFRDVATGTMVERSWSLPYDSAAVAFDRAAPSLQLAGTAALLAEKLRGGPAAAEIRLRELGPVVNSLRGHYAQQPRVQALSTMFAQTRRLTND